MKFDTLKELDSQCMIQNYGRFPAAFARGKGACLYDFDGKEYIDFGSGIGVNSLGYGHPAWAKAVCNQAKTLAHASNLFYTEPYVKFAQRLTILSGMAAAFFCNSGAEANEAAIKLARKYSSDKYGSSRGTILTLRQSFHGRTLATVTATGQDSFHTHFYPFPEGFRYTEAEEEALEKALTDDVCAVLIEGVQGEGGVIPLEKSFVTKLRELTAEKDILLIFDEVQTGNGRTGFLYSYQYFGVIPDAFTTAKGLAGGLPLGALLVSEKVRDVLGAGTHGSTFGGNPVCCAGACAVLDVLETPGFMDSVAEKGIYIKETISGWGNPLIKEVRGLGLMIGISLDESLSVKTLIGRLLEQGVIALSAGGNTLRLLPPLVISYAEIDQGLSILKGLL